MFTDFPTGYCTVMLAYEFASGSTATLTERARPVAPEGGVVVDVVAAGICGTDLKILRGEHRLYPAGTVRVPGHEFVGRVRESRVAGAGFAPGELVAIAPNIACGHCAACRVGRGNLCLNYESVGLTFDGAFAESVALPPRAVEQGNLLRLPEGTDPVLAVLVEPLAAVLRGLRALDLPAGGTLLIIGAGPIGLLAIRLARQLGAERVLVSQTSAARRELALEFGADAAVDPRAESLPAWVAAQTDGLGADGVLVCAPSAAAFGDALRSAALGGRVNFFAGLPSGRGEILLDANLIHYRELTVTGSTANTTDDCVDALELLLAAPDAYRPVISHTMPLDRIDEALGLMRDGVALKAVVQP